MRLHIRPSQSDERRVVLYIKSLAFRTMKVKMPPKWSRPSGGCTGLTGAVLGVFLPEFGMTDAHHDAAGR